MKITRMNVYTVDACWRNWIFVILSTDNGFVGVGEATTVYNDALTLAALEDLRGFVIGADPCKIEELWYKTSRSLYSYYRHIIFYSAMAAIDHAMWDIVGKWLNTPCYKLMGGAVRDSVRLYANTWFLGARTPEEYAKRASEIVAQGWDALKWDPFPGSYMTMTNREVEAAVLNMRAVREAVGPKVDLLIETHGRLDAESAVRAGRALESFRPFWYEEPVAPHNPSATRKVKDHVRIPIAGGERMAGRWGVLPFLRDKSLDIIQPDMTQAGGLSEVIKIAALAKMHDVWVAPHCPRGPVAVAAGVHFAARTPNFLILEYATDVGGVPWRQELLTEPEAIVNGRFQLPQKPGLGVDLNVAVLEKHKAHGFICDIPDFYSSSFTIPGTQS
ncbi:MAG: mandelate racemase/muconate lactonizing enzyme family protein [Acidobacteriia bacterium]|nr:mandelate racemase/muconate lactonizing enzyme family protein [Terriglobia bacterium]